MATTRQRNQPPATITGTLAEAKNPRSKRATTTKPTAKRGTKKARAEMLPLQPSRRSLMPARQHDSLVAWCELYLTVEGAGSDNTFKAKRSDLTLFLQFLTDAAGTDHPDQWTRSLTEGFVKHRTQQDSYSTINRRLATLRHLAKWIHRQRPFLAGNPTANVKDFELDDPKWKGLEDIDVTRVKSAAEQLIHLKHRSSQQPIRDYAILLVLLHTALRVSELLALDLKQYRGKHLRAVARKGRKVTDKVFLPKAAREALDRYLSETRGTRPGPLLCSKSGNRLARQNVAAALKAIANQANANLPDDQRIHLAAHLLRHTNLRKTANEYGVQYAKEQSGHASDRYIWRYVQPSDEEKEQAQEDLF